MEFQRTAKEHCSRAGTIVIVAGVMSGTSCDGINVALVKITAGIRGQPKLRLLGDAQFSYPKPVREAVLGAMNSSHAIVADLSRLNFLLAELYADALIATQRRFRVKIQLAGCHGQTLYHQGGAAKFLGRKLAVTWQAGDGSVIAARVGVPVVSDFRPADMAAGGKGAPLVPFLDYCLFRDRRVGRVIQNIGGIANLTAIPAGASPEEVIAFDTGPGNMVIDALTELLFRKPFDRDGVIAASGTVLGRVVSDVMRFPYFRRKPPKTAGREEFGREFGQLFLRKCGRADKRDVIATATALTAHSIADALRRFVLKDEGYKEFVVSGGGTNNPTLLAMLANLLAPLGLQIRLSDEFGIPSEAKEAVAFALLAYQTWNRKPSNIPAATGAKRPAILGKVSYV
jgi:anhydro-N-acetylmuramic acid kinase